jgi:ATP-dependent RNA helicase DDX3X
MDETPIPQDATQAKDVSAQNKPSNRIGTAGPIPKSWRVHDTKTTPQAKGPSELAEDNKKSAEPAVPVPKYRPPIPTRGTARTWTTPFRSKNEKTPFELGSSSGSRSVRFARDPSSQDRPERGALQRMRIRSRNPAEEKRLFGDPNRQKAGIHFNDYLKLPIEESGENIPPAFETFEELKLPETLSTTIQLMGYETPTPIQRHAIPYVMARRDAICCAQTGSGKSFAFILPLVKYLIDGRDTKTLAIPPPSSQTSRNRSRPIIYPYVVIMAPTRELATQIKEEADKCTYRTGFRACVAHGGERNRVDQLRDMERGCDILIGTPGRLSDFVEEGRLSFACVSHLILDEGDRMLDMGFMPQMRSLINDYDMPLAGRHTMLFSATFAKEVQSLAQEFLSTGYIFLSVGRVGSATDNVEQHFMNVEEHNKRDQLLDVIAETMEEEEVDTETKKKSEDEGKTEDSNATKPVHRILVFVETKRDADGIEAFLTKQGIVATSIHGDRTQPEREDALRAFKQGTCAVLVATDVASRGLDIPNVTLVVNYSGPHDADSYVHRIGRAGRAGNVGKAITFLNSGNVAIAEAIGQHLREAKKEVPAWFDTLRGRGAQSIRRGGFGGGSGGRYFGGRDARPKYEVRDAWSSKPMPLRSRPEEGDNNPPPSTRIGTRAGGAYSSASSSTKDSTASQNTDDAPPTAACKGTDAPDSWD